MEKKKVEFTMRALFRDKPVFDKVSLMLSLFLMPPVRSPFNRHTLGTLSLSFVNEEGTEFIQPGKQYKVTIEEIPITEV